jgi:hypothetical protein
MNPNVINKYYICNMYIIKVRLIYCYTIIYYMTQIIESKDEINKQLLTKTTQKSENLCKYKYTVQNKNRKLIYGVNI